MVGRGSAARGGTRPERCRDQADQEHHRPGHPEAHLEISVVELDHDEVPEEHHEVGDQSTDTGSETDHGKSSEEEEKNLGDRFHLG